jgi:hypothetical protein
MELDHLLTRSDLTYSEVFSKVCHNSFYIIITIIEISYIFRRPSPLAARSKAWVYDRRLAGILDSNPAGGMDVCV